MKKEAKFQTLFSHWTKNVFRKTACFELKQTEKDSIPFDSVVPHQVQALLNAKNSNLFFKIPDGSFSPSPFDCFNMNKVPAYVVIKYPDFFCLIDIDDWMNEVKMSPRKSLTSDRAKEISQYEVML